MIQITATVEDGTISTHQPDGSILTEKYEQIIHAAGRQIRSFSDLFQFDRKNDMYLNDSERDALK